MGLRDYIAHHSAELRRGGFRALAVKAWHFASRMFMRLVFLIPALIAVGIIRLVRPVRLVRVGRLLSERIGHYVGNTEIYLCQRDDGQFGNAIDVFYHPHKIANKQIKKMWDRVLHTSLFWEYVDWVNRLIPGCEPHILLMSLVDTDGAMTRCDPHLSFTDAEERKGAAEVQRILGATDAEWVCVHSRDGAYLRAVSPFRDWSYHDHRDSSVENFVPAMQMLAERGLYAVRMGAAVSGAVSADDPRIIDYANRGRSEFMDVYLEAHCRFHVGDPTGLNEIPRAFRRPVVYTNFIPIECSHLQSMAPGGIVIPKKLWLRDGERYMTFAEVINSFEGEDAYLAQTYVDRNIEVIENTAEEIAAVVREMDDRLRGTWVETDDDRELQRAFWRLFDCKQPLVAGLRIGADFLRENRELLEAQSRDMATG